MSGGEGKPVESIDRRTKSEADIEFVTAARFFDERLPELLATNGPLAARGMRQLGLAPLGVEVDGFAFTLQPDGDTLMGGPGLADGAMVLELDPEQFSDWVQELRTVTAFVTARDAGMRNGRTSHFIAWDLVLRAILDGRPVHEPGAIAFKALDGSTLDLGRSFRTNDDADDIAHFLREAGFLHLRGWLDPSAMTTIAADVRRALPSYRPDDGRSWWATLADGTEHCVRLEHFVEHSPATAAILDSPEWDRLRQVLAGQDTLLRPRIEGNVIEALVKPIGVVKGISDVPWHRDCAFGRHSYTCCGVTVGISVTDSDELSGQLRVVAGSHRAATPSTGLRRDLDLPVVPLPTRAGDLTVHLSCTMHEAVPPVKQERLVMYTGFGLPPRPDDRGAGRERLSDLRERSYKLQSQPPNEQRITTPPTS